MKATDVRKEFSKTGGGPAPSSLTDLEFKVVSLIPQCQIEGIVGGLESEVVESLASTMAMTGNSDEATSMKKTEESAETRENQTTQASASNANDIKLKYSSGQKRKCAEMSYQPPKHISSVLELEKTQKQLS